MPRMRLRLRHSILRVLHFTRWRRDDLQPEGRPEYHRKEAECGSVLQAEFLLCHFNQSAADWKRCGCSRRRHVQYVQHVASVHDVEVVNQGAVRIESLG